MPPALFLIILPPLIVALAPLTRIPPPVCALFSLITPPLMFNALPPATSIPPPPDSPNIPQLVIVPPVIFIVPTFPLLDFVTRTARIPFTFSYVPPVIFNTPPATLIKLSRFFSSLLILPPFVPAIVRFPLAPTKNSWAFPYPLYVTVYPFKSIVILPFMGILSGTT